MKQVKIFIVKTMNRLHFYLVTEKGRYYLFEQKFSKGVYEYFRSRKSLGEVHSFKRWGRNPRLDKTIEKLPLYIQYVRKEEEPYTRAA